MYAQDLTGLGLHFGPGFLLVHQGERALRRIAKDDRDIVEFDSGKRR